MWTKEKLAEAAIEWAKQAGKGGYLSPQEKDRIYLSFLAGCEYIINNTQKEYGE